MAKIKLGVSLRSLAWPLRRALQEAQRAGAQGVEMAAQGDLAPRGLSFAVLADREVEVLRLVAEGLDTAEIASRLSYSQRTIKTVLHDVTTRLQLRNRSHAVAYALREGLI